MKQNPFFITNFNDSKKLTALVILLVASLAFTWELVISFHTEKLKIVSKPPNVLNIREQLSLNSPFLKISLFGEYVPANLSGAEIKQSMLDVQIVGIMFASKEAQSQVVLRLSGGKEENYTIGDVLPGGAIIKRISPDGVVVLHNGSLESLSLPKNELIFDLPERPLIKE